VHRDLKPGNVMLTKSGVKLLDFGLAKFQAGGRDAAASSASRLATEMQASQPLTERGTVLGTFQYMAPEQLEGKEADARSDIFAFGAVLYEMVTGRRAFQGKSQVSLMAAILDQEPPPISELQPVSLPLLEHLVKTCLAKNPDARWQHAGDLLIQLKLIAEQGARPAQPERAARTGRSTYIVWIAAAVLLVTTVTVAGLIVVGRDAPAPATISFQVETLSAPAPLQIAISPDGARIAAIVTAEGGSEALWVRALQNLDGQTLPRTDGAQFPFWSPDGRSIGFFADAKLKKVDLLGAPPQILCDAPVGGGGTWNRDGVIVFAPTQTGPLFQVSAAGGTPVQLTELDTSQGETTHRHPLFLPDADHFLYTAVSAKQDQSAVYVGSLSSKERKRLVQSTLKAAFASDHLLFMRDNNTLMAQRFDTGRLELIGDPFPAIAEDVGINLANSAAGFTVSANGILAYRSGVGLGQRVMMTFDPAGKQLATIGAPASYSSPAISPDARRVAVSRQDGGTGNIWIFDLIRGTSSRFTFDAGIDTAPVWSPDGAQILFSANRGGRFDLYLKNAGGVGQEEALLTSDHAKLADDWSRDGRLVLYRDQNPKTGWDVWALPLEGDRKPRPLVQTPFTEFQGRFSPDGRWFAYTSDETGRPEVYVQSFPPSGGKWQISTSGGVQPRWGRDGRELYFHSASNEATAVDITTTREGIFTAGVPRKLFGAILVNRFTDRSSWDVTPNGDRFLVTSTTGQAAQAAGQVAPITVVVNWLAGS
jgi:Tol biopolymer transport system component